MKKKAEEHIDINSLIELTKSDLMKDIYSKLEKVAETDANVMLVGENGAGKNFAARLIHQQSLQNQGPFHAFFCSAVDESNFKRAFQGQLTFSNDTFEIEHPAVEKARGGLLYLDRFTDLSVENQVHLAEIISGAQHNLDLYQGADPVPDLRVVLSVDKKAFRRMLQQDYWHYIMEHLNPISIWLPPLRAHREDIPPLVELFLSRFSYDLWNAPKQLEISLRALYKCISYHWPGNIRQLKNAILNAAVQAEDNYIKAQDLPFSLNWDLRHQSKSIAAEQLKSFKTAEKQLMVELSEKPGFTNRKGSIQMGEFGFRKTIRSVSKT